MAFVAVVDAITREIFAVCGGGVLLFFCCCPLNLDKQSLAKVFFLFFLSVYNLFLF